MRLRSGVGCGATVRMAGILCLAVGMGGLGSSSSSAKETGLRGNLGFYAASPQGEFADNVDATGYGVQLFGGYRIPRSPVILGLDFGFLVYGDETRKEPFSTTIPDVTVDVNTSNNIVTGGLVLRLQPASGIVRPYLDGTIGFNYLTTQTTIKDESGEEIAKSTNQDDSAFALGGGAGAEFAVYRPHLVGGEGPQLQEVLIGLGVRYRTGGEADYLKEGSIRRENGQVFYDLQRSKTDMVTFSIDVGVAF